MNFPQKLQEFRRREKLSQEDLAQRLGVSRQSVSKWEQGLSFPETEKLIELSTMMGLSIDCLLKDTPEEPIPATAPAEHPAPEKQSQPVPMSTVRKHWLPILMILLLAAVSLFYVSLFCIPQTPDTPGDAPSQMDSQPSLPPETTIPPETTLPPETTVPPETEPVPTDPGLRTPDLEELQAWFFDFARDYRLDYMPRFTREDGPPKDACDYLNWAFVINLENWGDEKGTMRKSYVDNTIYTYFRTSTHDQGNESWTYDNISQVYTIKPGGINEPDYYLLNSIEIRDGEYTVHATRYYSRYIYLSPEEVLQLRDALFNGTNMDLQKASELTITFALDPNNDYEPIFYSYSETFVTEFMS